MLTRASPSTQAYHLTQIFQATLTELHLWRTTLNFKNPGQSTIFKYEGKVEVRFTNTVYQIYCGIISVLYWITVYYSMLSALYRIAVYNLHPYYTRL